MEKKKKAPASRVGGKQACLCKDGTYKKECCNGSTIAQGIYTVSELTNAEIIQEITPRTFINGNIIN
jgi:hypothetical protein